MKRKGYKQPNVFKFLRRRNKKAINSDPIYIQDDKWIISILNQTKNKTKWCQVVGLGLIVFCWVPLLFHLPIWVLPILLVVGLVHIYISEIPSKKINMLMDLYFEEALHGSLIIGEIEDELFIPSNLLSKTNEYVLKYKRRKGISDKLKYDIICKYNNSKNKIIFMRENVVININNNVKTIKYDYNNIYDLLDEVAKIINQMCR